MRRHAQHLAWIALGLAMALAAGDMIMTFTMAKAETVFAYVFGDMLYVMTGCCTSMVGALVAHQRSRNPLGWIMLVIGLAITSDQFLQDYARLAFITNSNGLPGASLALSLTQALWLVPHLGLVFLLLLFPTGRLLSPRWRWMAVFSLLSYGALLALLIVSTPMPITTLQNQVMEIPNPIGLLEFGPSSPIMSFAMAISPLTVLISLMTVVLRFRRADYIERQQLKWFMYTAALFAVLLIPAALVSDSSFGVLLDTAALMMPLAIGIAILRYHLFDIDILIRRTLIYGLLTAILGLVYFVSVVVLQQFFRNLTGQSSDLAIVVSTLAIAALFNPVRHRVQRVIDRRFYHRRYDAAKVLRAFGATVRDEVDLSRLTLELQAVVEETMQPTQTSLWLREPNPEAKSE